MPSAENQRQDNRFLLLVLLGGIALRLIWLVQVHGRIDALPGVGEASNVAIAFAHGRGIADAFYPGYGPTAHMMPVTPGISGFILWLCGGVNSVSALVLLAWALAQVVGAWLLARALFQRLGADPRVTRWGVAIMAFVPAFVPQEVMDFRFWEGGLALCLGLANLLLIQDYHDRRDLGWPEMLAVAGLSAVTFFVSPPVGLAVDLCWAIFALTRLPFLRCVQLATVSAAALALLVVPWTIRNERALGDPIPLRSNLGNELALALHSDALSGRPPEVVFADRVLEISPYLERGHGRVARQQAGSEAAYSRKLATETGHWIAGHPGGFAQLLVRHLSEFFFPRPWQMYFTGWEGMRELRSLAVSLINLLGLIGLAIGLSQRRRGYGMLATYIAAIALPYTVFQPMARYYYLVHVLLAFLAVEAVLAGRAYLSERKGPGTAR